MAAEAEAAEYVLEGHPDKVCDILADAVLDDYLAHDAQARVACEVLISRDCVVVAGEVRSVYTPDLEPIVRDTLTRIGYTDSDLGFSAQDCRIIQSLSPQSQQLADIAAPDKGRLAPASDQSIVVGYATRNAFGMIPPASFLAKHLACDVATRRHADPLTCLGPDGKTLVCVTQVESRPHITKVVVASQHRKNARPEEVSRQLREVVFACVERFGIDLPDEIIINPPNGRFSNGGPGADTGLTGRKLVADLYGPSVRCGGGALSGKDPSKIDRCGAYAARWIAKSMVASGLVSHIELTLAYVIGAPQPAFIEVRGVQPESRHLAQLIRDKFDLRPGALVETMGLNRPLYEMATRAAHVGITNSLPWELARTDL